jgi:hydrocephalus-inducing protein
VPRRVSIVQPENRLFQVTPYIKKNKKGDSQVDISNTKVAPGMEVKYCIKFTPEAKVDVSYDLIVITEREKFIVPIRGIGCKVMLEFMDRIDFGEVPVKYRIEKPIILRNVGEKITKWMLKCSSTNINVSKKEGILGKKF